MESQLEERSLYEKKFQVRIKDKKKLLVLNFIENKNAKKNKHFNQRNLSELETKR